MNAARVALLVVLLGACVGQPRVDDLGSATSGASSSGAGSESFDGGSTRGVSDAGGESSQGRGDAESGAEDPKLDVASDRDPISPGCHGIDFLFVVDNSLSLTHYQQAMVASIPGFIDTLESVAQTQDFHVMVVDTDSRSVSAPDCYGGHEDEVEACNEAFLSCLAAGGGEACSSELESCLRLSEMKWEKAGAAEYGGPRGSAVVPQRACSRV